MRPERLSAVLASLLILTTMIALPGVASADESESVLLPWVPNQDYTGQIGPWFSRIEIQNPSANPCSIQIGVPKTGGGWTYQDPFNLDANALAIRSPSEIGLPAPGGAVIVNSTGCKVAVSVKEASTGFSDPPWSRDANAITGYTGIPSEDTTGNPEWILPIVQTSSGWNSYIRITNTEATNANKITVQIYPNRSTGGQDGWIFSETVLVDAGATQMINLHDAIGRDGFVGFALITSDGGVAALVQREKPVYGMAMINVATAYPSDLATIAVVGNYALQAPIIFNAYNGWNTGINLANPNNAAANVTISYPGAGRPDDVLTMAPYSSQFVYTPVNAPNQTGFTGNAVIYSNVPVAAAVDEVKYSTNDAISYIAVPAIDSQVAIPLVFRQSTSGTRNDNSGINVSNGNDTKTTVKIRIYDRSGNSIGGPFSLTIPAHSSDFIYMASTPVPPETVGSAIVQSDDGTPIVVVSNDVSYDVTLDGSVVFNAPSASGLYHIGGAPPS